MRFVARNVRDPASAPDGPRLVAGSSLSPYVALRAVYVVSLDGTNTPITRDPVSPGSEMIVEHYQPDWQALR